MMSMLSMMVRSTSNNSSMGMSMSSHNRSSMMVMVNPYDWPMSTMNMYNRRGSTDDPYMRSFNNHDIIFWEMGNAPRGKQEC